MAPDTAATEKAAYRADQPSRLQAAMSLVIRQALTEDGATQADLARHLGISQKHLSRMLNGRDEGSLTLWSRMLDLAGVCHVELPLLDVVPFVGALRYRPEQASA